MKELTINCGNTIAKLWMPSMVPPAIGVAGATSSGLVSYSSKVQRRINGWRSELSRLVPGDDRVRVCEGRLDASTPVGGADGSSFNN